MRKKAQWGSYKSAVRRFSVLVPLSWSITELDDQLEIQSPGEDVFVIISSFTRSTREPIDVVAQLQRFLDSAKIAGRAEIRKISSRKISAEYRDADGAIWYVLIEAKEQRFILASCNTGAGSGRHNYTTGREVVESITFIRQKKVHHEIA